MTANLAFRTCVEAINDGALIVRATSQDKEFHFQNWFASRLEETGLAFERGARNSYPDFRIVSVPDGYELKGLAYPGRDVTFDSNSQPPTGLHNDRNIYYVFGRYPSKPDGDSFPVLDLVICHGDFLNADHEYVHKNRSLKGFGTYGDLMIRDRKMYVVPTPFHLVNGTAHQQTLILDAESDPGKGYFCVGELTRVEATDLITGYHFDLEANSLSPETRANPNAGTQHLFRSWRLSGSHKEPVSMRPVAKVKEEISEDLVGDDVDEEI
jgi:hypothetical protein